MFESRNKNDLIIEVWEKLDCESVGADEICAIEEAVRGRFGDQAVDSPMVVARLLADEGAELRHSEIMQFYVERRSDRPYDAALRNLIDLTDLKSSLSSIRAAENLRRKYKTDGDKEGLRLLREKVFTAKKGALQDAANEMIDPQIRSMRGETAEWLTLWLQSPGLFENWIKIRTASEDFIKRFSAI